MTTFSDFESSVTLIPSVYDPLTIIVNLSIASALGLVVSSVYKTTHKGLSYSQSFMLTIVFVTVVVAMVMMVIGNNLARAFALVGALSIIRFRTVIKDTKDTVFVFLALAAGMASGTSSYFLAFAGVIIISIFAIVLHRIDYGSIYKSEIIVRFRAKSGSVEDYENIFKKFARSAELLHLESSGDDHSSSFFTFDLLLKKNAMVDQLANELAAMKSISEVKIIASKTDVDY